MTKGGSLNIELGWPAAELSPNSRAHYMVVARFKKAARTEAGWATKAAMNIRWAPDKMPIPVHITAHPPEAWRTGDADNLVSRCKGFLDGIADALEVNDRDFDAPTVEFADRCKLGKLIVSLG